MTSQPKKVNCLGVYDRTSPSFAYKICEDSGKEYLPEVDEQRNVVGFYEFLCKQEQRVPLKAEDAFRLAIGERSPFAYYASGKYIIEWNDYEFARKLKALIESSELPLSCKDDLDNFLHDYLPSLTYATLSTEAGIDGNLIQILMEYREALSLMAVMLNSSMKSQESVSYESPRLLHRYR